MQNNTQTIESNELIDRLPPHLKQFIKPQDYENYSAIDHALWRYVMQKNVQYLAGAAHGSYLNGLKKTGISVDAIPNMYGMNRILKSIGWAAVAVDGFIPPNAFMEFQAYKVLVIASDIRQLENIEYTPAPDIIHEAAGHAPIIANPDYAEYLRRLGEIGAKAISSKYDVELYEAVRKLSILKEAAGVSAHEIDTAQKVVEALQQTETTFSEMAQIRNLQWWTVEYGLVGTMEAPKIYGAGLLSSIGESKWCMGDEVKKIPFSIAAANIGFDITKPQPHLFVTPHFSYLMQVLDEFANTMSVRKGGYKGLQKLIASGQVGTIELSTGLQVSGIFTAMLQNDDREVIYFQTQGPTALAYREKECIGHGVKAYPEGFSSPLGKLKSIHLDIEDMGPLDLKAYNFIDGQRLYFEFESGITVEGLNVTGIRNIQGKLILVQLTDCTVTYKNELLFGCKNGIYNMAVGKEITAAFAGAADHLSFPGLNFVSPTITIRHDKTPGLLQLEKHYQAVKTIRDLPVKNEAGLMYIFKEIEKHYPADWLLATEIFEITKDLLFKNSIKTYLTRLSNKNPKLSDLIAYGLEKGEHF